MCRMRRGWQFVTVATAAVMVAMLSGCSSDTLSLIYNIVTVVLDVASTAATDAT